MGNRRLGKKRLARVFREAGKDGLALNTPADDNDRWGEVRPAIVPGLHRNMRLVAFGQMHGFGFEDTADVPVDGQTTAVWLRDNENSSTIALKANDADFTDGAVVLTTGGAASDQTALLTAAKMFQCTTGKKWWIETSLKVDDIDKTEMFFGLVEANYTDGENLAVKAAAGGADSLGFCKNVHTTGAIKIRQNLNTDSGNDIDISPSSAVTLAADTDVLTMGIYWDGAGSVRYYAKREATGTEVGGLPLLKTITTPIPDQKMALVLQIAEGAGATAAESMTVNYIRGMWEI